MAYEKRTPQYDWRAKLTAEEREQVKALEKEMRELKKRKAEAAARLSPIRNRAIQRARYEAASA